MNNWAFQVSRSIYESDIWYKPPEWLKIWLYILGNVNYWDTKQFKRWENFFKYEVIASLCGCSINTVNKCVKFLKEAEQIQNRKTSRWAIISVINYDTYQDLWNYGRTEAEQKQNKSRTSTNTIKEEYKNIKKEEYISKDIISINTSWNADINKMQEFIKNTVEELWYIYKAWKQERGRIKNILTWKEINTNAKKCKMDIYNFVGSIFLMSTKLDFRNGKINNAETFYKHYVKIMNDAISLKQSIQNSAWVVEVDF